MICSILIDIENIESIQKNINALNRFLNYEQTSIDFVLLIDTISILQEIKKQAGV